MKNETATAVLALIDSTVMVDHDKRSALGMADSWMRTGKMVMSAPEVGNLYKNRDNLALALVELVREAKRKDAMGSLAAARAHINKPFIDPAVQAQRAKQAAAGPVGSEKKNEKMGL